jgi:heme/copper-type cytochrome/quinol oxidase subunit 2
MMKKTSVIYYLISLVLFVYLVRQIIGSSSFDALAPHVPALFLVLFPVIFLLMTHFSPAEIIKAFKLAGRKSGGTKSELNNAALFFQTALRFFVTVAVIGIFILITWNLAGGFDAGQGPPRVAHAVLIIVGAICYPMNFILFICLPFSSAIRKKLNQLE